MGRSSQGGFATSAFPEGKQNEIINRTLQLGYLNVNKLHPKFEIDGLFKRLKTISFCLRSFRVVVSSEYCMIALKLHFVPEIPSFPVVGINPVPLGAI